jgi:hypothetical protein
MAKQDEQMCPVKTELFGFRCGLFSLHFGRKQLPFLHHVFMIKVHFKYPLFELGNLASFDEVGFFLKFLF